MARAQTNIRAELPSGKVPTTHVRLRLSRIWSVIDADQPSTHSTRAPAVLAVEAFNDVVRADPRPVFRREIAVGQGRFHALLHRLCDLFQLYYDGPGLFTGGLGWIALDIFATCFIFVVILRCVQDDNSIAVIALRELKNDGLLKYQHLRSAQFIRISHELI